MTSPLQVDIDVLTKTVTGLRNSQQILADALKAMADVGAMIRTTLGKALFGLRLRQEDGSYPTLWRLIKQWFVGVFVSVATPLQILG